MEINLIDKTTVTEKMERLGNELADSSPCGKFKKGDIISFWGGMNNDIRYTTKITGFDKDDIYLLWDCFWYPIQDVPSRDIKLV